MRKESLRNINNYQAFINLKGKDVDNIAYIRMNEEVFKIREHYERIQKYGYMADGIEDLSKPVPISKILFHLNFYFLLQSIKFNNKL